MLNAINSYGIIVQDGLTSQQRGENADWRQKNI